MRLIEFYGIKRARLHVLAVTIPSTVIIPRTTATTTTPTPACVGKPSITFVETKLINRHHYDCDPGIGDMLVQIPKRKKELKSGFRIVEYGLHPEQDLAFWRFCLSRIRRPLG